MSTVKRNRAVLRIRIASYVHGSVGGADSAVILAEEVDWHRSLLPLSSYPKRRIAIRAPVNLHLP